MLCGATYLSQACAILVCAFAPTLMTFMGNMPGMAGKDYGDRRALLARYILLTTRSARECIGMYEHRSVVRPMREGCSNLRRYPAVWSGSTQSAVTRRLVLSLGC